MKIFFIGSVEFSKRVLQKLVDLNAQVVGVCTKKKNNFNNDYADLRPICKKNKIPYKIVEDINSEKNLLWVKSFKPDIIFCFGWSNLLKKKILNLPTIGVLGYHPSNLPQNRGRHPLIWSLVLGIKKSASTYFFMNEGVDSGDILSQKKFDISISDNASTLYDKISDLAIIQLVKFLPKLQNRTYKSKKQNKKKFNIWRKRTKDDGRIDFRMSSIAIYNLVRALSKPYPGAHIQYNGNIVKIWKIKIVKNSKNFIESGKVLNINGNKILVKTYDGSIEIIQHEFKKLPKIGEYI